MPNESTATPTTAGRELDALIAEKVMGWGWVGRQNTKWFAPLSTIGTDANTIYGPIRAACDDDKAEDGWWLRDSVPAEGVEVVPHYSTEIAAAWMVVEKLTGYVSKREHPWWSVAVFNAQRNQVGCRVYACPPGSNIFETGSVTVLPNDDANIIAGAVGNDAPHAICRAALAAVKVETITLYCDADLVSTDRTCGECGVAATPETIARWFIDEDPKWDRCDEHHPYNGPAASTGDHSNV